MQPDVAIACAVCFGAADAPMLDAARVGVLVMVGVTCGMLAALAALVIRLARRAEKGDSPLFRSTEGDV